MAKTILVVDDEPHIVKMVEARLQTGGYRVITAEDGIAGLEKAHSERPDLIILDLMLPKRDGWRVCQMLKNDTQYAHIPVILLSALVGEESPAGGAEIGDAYLAKPFRGEELLVKVRALLKEA